MTSPQSIIFSVLQWIDNSREAARIADVCENHSSLKRFTQQNSLPRESHHFCYFFFVKKIWPVNQCFFFSFVDEW